MYDNFPALLEGELGIVRPKGWSDDKWNVYLRWQLRHWDRGEAIETPEGYDQAVAAERASANVVAAIRAQQPKARRRFGRRLNAYGKRPPRRGTAPRSRSALRRCAGATASKSSPEGEPEPPSGSPDPLGLERVLLGRLRAALRAQPPASAFNEALRPALVLDAGELGVLVDVLDRRAAWLSSVEGRAA